MPTPKAHKSFSKNTWSLQNSFGHHNSAWSAVLIFYGTYHYLLYLLQVHSENPSFPPGSLSSDKITHYDIAIRFMRNVNMPKEVIDTFRGLLELSYEARYKCPTKTRARFLEKEAKSLSSSIKKALKKANWPVNDWP